MKIEKNTRTLALPLTVLALAVLSACAPMDRDRRLELSAPDEGTSAMQNKSSTLGQLLSKEQETERFTLLPQSDGRPSALAITSGADRQTVLDKPLTQAQVKVQGGNQETAPVTNASVNSRYVDAITALPVTNFTDLVKRTVLSNPEVQARWHGMKLARYQRSEALAQFLPSLDFFASIRREWITRPGAASFSQAGRSTRATLSHNLYNGFADTNNLRRTDHVVRGRYFDLLDISEEAAFEAARAHLDVARYTKLSELAADNLAVHQEIQGLIEERARSGVDRRVDVELAIGRTALARSNLATEEANLHDVSARYVRITGVRPTRIPGGLPASLKQRVPGNLADGLREVLAQSPAVRAAQENYLATDLVMAAHAARFQPRFDLVASVESANDFSAINGNTKDSRLGIDMNWNLYRGNSDVNRRTQYEESRSEARFLHESVCRETRYNFEQTYTEYQKLVPQLDLLDQHRITTDKALQAYRQQFAIGQRTLLDVLDVQNEYFEAERDYANTEFRIQVVLARLQYIAGRLLPALGVLPLADQEPATALPLSTDGAPVCDTTPSEPMKLDREALLKQAVDARSNRR